jgi:hypothetical protein
VKGLFRERPQGNSTNRLQITKDGRITGGRWTLVTQGKKGANQGT